MGEYFHYLARESSQKCQCQKTTPTNSFACEILLRAVAYPEFLERQAQGSSPWKIWLGCALRLILVPSGESILLYSMYFVNE